MSVDGTVLMVVLVLLGFALVMAVVRLIRGPGLPDRVVAMEFVATVGTAMLAVLAITSENRAYIDVMLLVALVSFLGTVAIAASIERRIHR